ncbi:Formylmethanofuran dehydrogenase subunit A [Candidatus Burkholderia pumila]|uniref:Formylmethanofuran dehydrogenase subunit A n=1 Tax=Candidatus Burkholderia pumila TaxID=1090375 RepID=A0ABR5HNU0_9BURK|nr:Formylmethanofuran dehydrogenase subunit A [Candidatus Burkholderia pumila]
MRLPSCGTCTPGTLAAGYRYTEMGYTAAFEPAMIASNARHAHLEIGNTPIIDHGAYVMMGNDKLFLQMLAGQEDFQRIRAIAEAVNVRPNVTIDVGKIMFGQTVTASGDTMIQFKNAPLARPRKWTLGDIEYDAGCGIVPFRYSEESYVNALQWIIGLEIFLLVDDPWRVSMTTDHPNGAPFTSYPHLIRLLMDKSFRDEQLDKLHADANHARL